MWRRFIDFFKIESLTTRVRLAFMSIALLLLFSGFMSLMELNRVSNDTEAILAASESNRDLAVEMRNALDKQHHAIINMAIAGEARDVHATLCEDGIRELSAAILRVEEIVANSEAPHSADSLVFYKNRINAMSSSYVRGEIEAEIANINAQHEVDYFNDVELFKNDHQVKVEMAPKQTTHKWYNDNYKEMYFNVLRQISKYEESVHNTLGPEVNNLNHTTRRTVTPVFITLLVMIAIVAMFYFFMMMYVVKPIRRINRSLGAYLAYKTPFDDSIHSRDEIRTVRDRIAALITRIR